MEEFVHALEIQHAQVRLVQGTPWLEARCVAHHVHAIDLSCGSGGLEGVEVVRGNPPCQQLKDGKLDDRLQIVVENVKSTGSSSHRAQQEASASMTQTTPWQTT
jgi:hypothetical protein